MNIVKASKKLSELDLRVSIDNFDIDILWFRAMVENGIWNIDMHTHSSFEFHFVALGACEVILDGETFIARAGEFYITAPGIYHQQKSFGNGHYIEYSINCDFRQLNDEFTEAFNIFKILSSARCLPIKDKYNAIKFFYQALEEAYYQKVGFYIRIKSLVVTILIMAVRALNNNDEILYNVPHKLKEDDHRFTMIKKFIEDNINGNITAKEIANYMHLSQKQVYRIVMKKTGRSIKDLIERAKLDRAKKLLKNTELSLKEIADELGFSSEYYFNQFFKREEGYPPGVYRKNIKNV